MEELGLVDFEEEIKKRTQMVYVPNWFSVDIKTGVSIATSAYWAFSSSYERARSTCKDPGTGLCAMREPAPLYVIW